ncbi:MAG: hypothetical protein GHCLOJNM_00423 [bacterium]|nr:hypothetical protein [bacterium]
MKIGAVTVAAVLCAVVIAWMSPSVAQPAQWPGLEEPVTGQAASPAQRAQAAPPAQAAVAKYQFLFFHKDQSPETQSLYTVFQGAMRKAASRAEPRVVNLNDPSETALVRRLGVDRAPMPMVMAIAPNGAIMGGFPGKFDETQILGAFGTPAQEKSLKAFQENKMVFLCVQNERTKLNEESVRGVYEFKNDPQFSRHTEVVFVNPDDPTESRFLQQLAIDPKTDTAISAFMTPPGVVLGLFPGPTDKNVLVQHLTLGGCGPDCHCLKSQQAQADSGGVLKKFFGKISSTFGKK